MSANGTDTDDLEAVTAALAELAERKADLDARSDVGDVAGPQWVIDYDGVRLASTDVTVAQAVSAAELLDADNWDAITPATGPRQLVAWVAVALVSAGRSNDIHACLDGLMQHPLAELTAAVEVT